MLVIIFVAYLAGGYVAGRMARFNGVKQGVGVWLWAIIIAVVVAVLSLIAGAQFNILGSLTGFPRLPVNEGQMTTGGIIVAILVVAVALVGAILGGLAGMRFHRRVDSATHDTTGRSEWHQSPTGVAQLVKKRAPADLNHPCRARTHRFPANLQARRHTTTATTRKENR